MPRTHILDGTQTVKATKKFALQKGEKARVFFPDGQLIDCYTHYITGVGYIECLGNPEVLSVAYVDPTVCPLCANSERGRDNVLIPQPSYRCAINLAQYLCQPGKTIPITPITISVHPWIFGRDKSSQVFSLMESARAESADGTASIQNYDFTFECTEEQWQRFTIQMMQSKPAYLNAGEAEARRVLAQFAEESSKNLAQRLCTTYTEDQMTELVQRLKGIPAGSREPASNDDLGLLGALGGDPNFDVDTIAGSRQVDLSQLMPR